MTIGKNGERLYRLEEVVDEVVARAEQIRRDRQRDRASGGLKTARARWGAARLLVNPSPLMAPNSTRAAHPSNTRSGSTASR
jgi:hypothetical protein